ncbi:hypothetical protein Tco_0660330 [Tanacetum coccineum]
MSNNNNVNQRLDTNMHKTEMDERYKPAKLAKGGVIHYGLLILDTLLNDTIREMDAYKEYVENSQEVIIPMVQPQPVDPTQGAHKNTRAEWVRRTGGKRLMRRGEGGVLEPAELHNTNIVLKRKTTSKEKIALKDKPVKEKRLKEKLERIEREQRLADEEIDDDLDDILEAMKTQKLKGVAEYDDDEPQITPDAQLLLDFKRTRKLSRQEALITELSKGQGEGSETRNETHELKDSLDSDQTLSPTRLDVVDEGEEDDVSNYKVLVHEKTKENISRYLNETPAPSLEDVGLPRIAGTSRLNSHDGSSGKEKPSGDSFDPDRLPESQTVVVTEVIMTEPTEPDQHGSIRVDYVSITPDETLTLELPPRGNPKLTSCTSGASANPSDVLAQNLNMQVLPITGADDPILTPHITRIITTKPTTSKQN